MHLHRDLDSLGSGLIYFFFSVILDCIIASLPKCDFMVIYCTLLNPVRIHTSKGSGWSYFLATKLHWSPPATTKQEGKVLKQHLRHYWITKSMPKPNYQNLLIQGKIRLNFTLSLIIIVKCRWPLSYSRMFLQSSYNPVLVIKTVTMSACHQFSMLVPLQ